MVQAPRLPRRDDGAHPGSALMTAKTIVIAGGGFAGDTRKNFGYFVLSQPAIPLRAMLRIARIASIPLPNR